MYAKYDSKSCWIHQYREQWSRIACYVCGGVRVCGGGGCVGVQSRMHVRVINVFFFNHFILNLVKADPLHSLKKIAFCLKTSYFMNK